MSFHWLHLSDLHLTPEGSFDTETAKRSLLKFLKKEINSENIKCNYLFLTGDIANKGDYSNVENFINDLFNAIGWTKDDYAKAFWAVGNHDINRANRLRNNNIEIIRRANDHSREFEDSMRDEGIRDVLAKQGMAKYIEYHQKLLNRPSTDIHSTYRLPNLNLIVINTCLTSYNDDDEKKLYIADRIFLNSFENLDANKPTFVIGHHGVRFFSDTQQGRLTATFDNEQVDLYLCGHSHLLGHEYFNNTNHNIHQIICGGLKGTSKFSFMHGYYDSEKETVLIKPYSYTEINQGNWGWRLDTNLHKKLDCKTPLTLTLKGSVLRTLNASKSNETNAEKLSVTIDVPSNTLINSKIAKTIGNLPPKNNNFTGRDDILHKIFIGLKSFSKVLIIGAPGFGKTQLAYEYAYRRHERKQYDYVWVMNAEDTASLERSYRRFAKHHGLPPAETDTFECVLSHVKLWLKTNSRYLIIFDNVGILKQGNARSILNIDGYLPDGKLHGHIMINTRFAKHSIKDVEIIKVDVFSLADAMNYLEKRLGGKLSSNTGDFQKIADLLGCFPLALGHASAYMLKHNFSSDEYIKELEERGLEVLTKPNVADEYYTETVATTVEISVKNIPVNSAELQLFNICAYFAPDKIPLSMLIKGNSALPSPLREALEPEQEKLATELESYSLLSWKHDDTENILVTIHRLIQQVVCNSFIDKKAQKTDIKWISCCIDVAYNSFRYEYGDLKLMAMFVQCVPHVFQIIRHFDNISPNNFDDYNMKREKIAGLYLQAGRGFGYDGKYSESLNYLYKALSLRKVLGKEHSDTAATYHNIGRVFSRQGNYSKAMHWFKKALDYRKNKLGLEHMDTAETCHDVARVLARRNNPRKDWQDEYRLAMRWYGRALKIREKAVGKKLIYAAATHNGIAEVNARQGRYYEKKELKNEAQKYYLDALKGYKEALKIDETCVEPNHPYIAVTQYNIAEVYYFMSELDKAEKWYKKALDIREKAFGTSHPHTAFTYMGIAKVYDKQEKYGDAIEWYEKALAITEKLSGEKNATATIHFRIGKIRHKEKSDKQARVHYFKALGIQEKMKCPQIGETYLSIAESFDSSCEYAKAVEFYFKVLSIQEKTGSAAVIKRVYNAISNAYLLLGKDTNALDYDEKARNIE